MQRRTCGSRGRQANPPRLRRASDRFAAWLLRGLFRGLLVLLATQAAMAAATASVWKPPRARSAVLLPVAEVADGGTAPVSEPARRTSGAANESVQKLEGEIKGLQQVLDEGEAPGSSPEKVRSARLAERVAELEKALAEKGSENDGLRARLAREETERKRLEERLARESERNRKERKTWEAREAELLRKLQERERERAALEQRRMALQETIQRLREEKLALAKERLRLRADLDNAEAEIADVTETLAQAWKERDQLEQAVEERDGRLARQQARIEELAREVARRSDALAQLQAEHEKLRRSLAGTRRERDQLAAVVRELRMAADRAATEIRRLTRDAGQRLARRTAEIAELRAQVKGLETRNAMLEGERVRLAGLVRRYERILAALRASFEPGESVGVVRDMVSPGGPGQPRLVAALSSDPPADGRSDDASARWKVEPAAGTADTGKREPREGKEALPAAERFISDASRLGLQFERRDDGRLVSVLEGLRFAVGSAEMQKDSLAAVARLAKLLKRHPGLRVRIVGHTDDAGDAAYNRKLSLARAESVVRLLAKRYGLPADQLQAAGLGEAQPLVSNDTDEGRRRNRRVEVWVETGSGPPATARRS